MHSIRNGESPLVMRLHVNHGLALTAVLRWPAMSWGRDISYRDIIDKGTGYSPSLWPNMHHVKSMCFWTTLLIHNQLLLLGPNSQHWHRKKKHLEFCSANIKMHSNKNLSVINWCVKMNMLLRCMYTCHVQYIVHSFMLASPNLPKVTSNSSRWMLICETSQYITNNNKMVMAWTCYDYNISFTRNH